MTDTWRYRCPRGHSNWKAVNDGYKCDSCEEWGDDPYFGELVDMKREAL